MILYNKHDIYLDRNVVFPQPVILGIKSRTISIHYWFKPRIWHKVDSLPQITNLCDMRVAKK